MLVLIFALFLLILAILLQSTLLQSLALAGVVPNLTLALVAVMGYLRGRKFGVIVGFLTGLAIDVLFFPTVGVNSFLYMLIGYLAGFCGRISFRSGFTCSFFLVGGADLIFGISFFILEFMLRGQTQFAWYFRRVILPEVCYTILAGFFVYHLLVPLNRWAVKFEYRED